MSTTEDHETNSSSDESQVYELSYLVLPSIPEEEVSKVVDSIQKIISKAGGKVFDSEAPHKRELAYEMTKVVGVSRYVVKEAYIGWLKFDLDSSNIEDVKTEVEKLDELVRFLIIKTTRETFFTFASTMKPEVMEMVEGEESEIDEDDDDSDTDEGDDTEESESD